MTGFEAYKRLETLNTYMEALNTVISKIDEPNMEFGSTYPSNIVKEIAAEIRSEQISIEERLVKVSLD